jgi:hypothetical protein
MPQSNSDAIWNASVATIQGLNLTLGSSPPVAVTVNKRKVGTVEPALASVPTISVECSRRGGRSQEWDTGEIAGRKWWEYLVEVDMSAPGNRDPTTGLPDYQSWRQVISRAFGDPHTFPVLLTGNDQLYNILVEPEGIIDQGAYKGLYDEGRMAMRFVTIESSV